MYSKFLLNFFKLCKEHPYKAGLTVLMATNTLTGQVCYKNGKQEVENKYNNVQTLIEEVLKHKSTYAPEFFSTSKEFAEIYGRTGAYVSIYPTKNIGAAAYILVHDTATKPKILLTIQERIIDKKKELVVEPPIGFFNAPFPSNNSVTPAEMEHIERNTTKLSQQGFDYKYIHAKRPYIVKEARELTKKGVLSREYQVDNDLRDTASRETYEEAGLDLKWLKKNRPEVQITQKILGSAEKPGVHREDILITIKGSHLIPKLKIINNDEVKGNRWVPIEDIDLVNGAVNIEGKNYRLKPYDQVRENIEQILNTEKTQNLYNRP